MKYINSTAALLLALSTSVSAQTPVQGPGFTRPLDVTGEVMTNTGAPYQGKPCVQLRVLSDVRYSGGRVWVCADSVAQLKIGERIAVRGTPSSVRVTKMGAARRAVPLLLSPRIKKF